MGVTVVQLYIYGLLIVLYFLDVNIDIDRRLKMIPSMILVIANKLMHVHYYVCGSIHLHYISIFLQTDRNHQSNYDHHNHFVDGSNSGYNFDIRTLMSHLSISHQWVSVSQLNQTNIPHVATDFIVVFHHIHCADYYNKYN